MLRSIPKYPILVFPKHIEEYLRSTKQFSSSDSSKNTRLAKNSQKISVNTVFQSTFKYQTIEPKKLKQIEKYWRVVSNCLLGIIIFLLIYQVFKKDISLGYFYLVFTCLGVLAYLRWLGIKIIKNFTKASVQEKKESEELFWQENERNNQNYQISLNKELRSKLSQDLSKKRSELRQKSFDAQSQEVLPKFPSNLQRGEIKSEAQKGVSESFLASYLKKYFEDCEITEDYYPLSSEKGYTSDFSIVEPQTGLGIDLEIDEPYEGKTKQPHHCTDNSKDTNRNHFFVEQGWIVLRVSEYQAVTQPESVCKLIAQILSKLSGDTTYLQPLLTVADLQADDCWSSVRAKQMAASKYRERYLDTAGIYRFSPEQEARNQSNLRHQKKRRRRKN